MSFSCRSTKHIAATSLHLQVHSLYLGQGISRNRYRGCVGASGAVFEEVFLGFGELLA